MHYVESIYAIKINNKSTLNFSIQFKTNLDITTQKLI